VGRVRTVEGALVHPPERERARERGVARSGALGHLPFPPSYEHRLAFASSCRPTAHLLSSEFGTIKQSRPNSGLDTIQVVSKNPRV